MATTLTQDIAPIRGGSTRYTYRCIVTENSQDIVKNTSNVTIEFAVKHSSWSPAYEGWNTHTGISVDGIAVNSGTNKKTVGTSYVTLLSWTGDVAHNSDGKKTIEVGVWLYQSSPDDYLPKQYTASSRLSMGTVELTTIPRKSGLTVESGDLGIAQTLTIDRKYNGFTDTIEYSCGTASGVIVSKTDKTSVSFTAPIELASQNTTGTAVSVAFTITTYSGEDVVGTTTKTVSYSMPDSVKPSCKFTITDESGAYAYIKGISKLYIEVTATEAYGAEIVSYKVTANGATYTDAYVSTEALKTAGAMPITVSVTDTRGRTGTLSTEILVLDYEQPIIQSLQAVRCNSDGTENAVGAYAKAIFSTDISDTSRNCSYVLEYKKAKDTEYTYAYLPLNNTYHTRDYEYVFAADMSSSYDIRLTVIDEFNNIQRNTAIGTAIVFISLWEDIGLAINKVAELEGVFDVGFVTRLEGGLLLPEIPKDTDIHDVMTPNVYAGAEVSTSNYLSCPISTGEFVLAVFNGAKDTLIQVVIPTADTADVYKSSYIGGAWTAWKNLNLEGAIDALRSDTEDAISEIHTKLAEYENCKILWDDSETGALYMNGSQTITLSEGISKQTHGIVLIFSYYNNGGQNESFSNHFIPKEVVARHPGCGHNINLFGMWANAMKYLYISDTTIKGHEKNSGTQTIGGISLNNSYYALRYVLGI